MPTKVKNKNEIQMTVAKMWSEIKLNYLTIDDRDNEVTRLINEWMKTYTENKMKMWGSFMKPNKAKPMIEMSTSEPTLEKDSTPTEPQQQPTDPIETITVEPSEPTLHPTPSQEKIKAEIGTDSEILLGFIRKRDIGQATSMDLKEIKSRQTQLDAKKAKLKTMELTQKRQQKFRLNQKRKIENLEKETGAKLTKTSREEEKEEYNKSLIEAMCRIAISGSAAHERRRTEVIRSVKTLDQLKNALSREGYEITRSALYLRVMPRNRNTREGKRHVTTAPVRLISAKNSAHNTHEDSKFARSTINALEELSGILGPDQVTFHSQDDKAKVPIGITAANKQAPLLMHVEYKVTLPDHDFVIAAQHKLIPSVIGDMSINDKVYSGEAVTYSGPTYVGIRSAKHTGSSAYHHLQDMKRIRSLEIFDDSFTNSFTQTMKPVMIVTVDGGPDENPCYSKSINAAIDYFVTFNLDAFFMAANAPGRSAFNRVERRMVQFSKELSGVLLPHDKYGTHLDSQGQTVDKELEIKNFTHAGKLLAELWSGMIIDGYPVVAEYISEEAEDNITIKSPQWKSIHVRQSQYFLQIVKCQDTNCCESFKSSYLNIVKDRFLPPPLSVLRKDGLLKWVKGDSEAHYLSLTQNIAMKDQLNSAIIKKYPIIPYDYSCPSVQPHLRRRICSDCNMYFATFKELDLHKDCHKRKKSTKKQTSLFPSPISSGSTPPPQPSPPPSPPPPRVRPQRIAAKRQGELLCAFAYQELEWMDMDDVDTEGFDIPNELTIQPGTPVISDVAPVWDEEEE